MDRDLRERVISVLLPHMEDVESRRALIVTALADCAVLRDIIWSGSANTFTRNLVDVLVAYGECTKGTPALVELLRGIKEDVGFNKREEIDTLIAEIVLTSPVPEVNTLQDLAQTETTSLKVEKDTTLGYRSHRQNCAKRLRAWTQHISRRVVFAATTIIIITVVGTLILPGMLNSQIGDSIPTPTVTVASNNQWQPGIEVFDGVEMVLVPAGCFDMGTNGLGGQQCFNTPFWIDRYEVSNGQFASFGGEAGASSNTTGERRPRTQLNWQEARQFCELRGARLPTEAEWEYAARGPDNLTYPWGNEWQPNYVAWHENSNEETATVDSYPEGASWVGAFNMSGNVWEWTNSLFRDYPYDPLDGREDINNTTEDRMMRGGAITEQEDYLTTVGRYDASPDGWYYTLGFRCARDFEEATPLAP